MTLFESDAKRSHAGEAFSRVSLTDGSTVDARLVIAADGGRSPLRAASGIRVRDWSYPQSAITTILAHDRPHGDVSTEFHTRGGPFTLVPLPGNRSSLVWVAAERVARRLAALDDAGLAEAVMAQAQGMLGTMRVDGPRGLVPMRGLSIATPVSRRLALIGEAAHVFPPIGAQGLNLGLRDAAALRDAVLAATRDGRDPGSHAALAGFARARRFDAALRSAAVDTLNRSLLADLVPVDALRGFGLLAMSAIGPLRRAVMREGVLPRLGAPNRCALRVEDRKYPPHQRFEPKSSFEVSFTATGSGAASGRSKGARARGDGTSSRALVPSHRHGEAPTFTSHAGQNLL